MRLSIPRFLSLEVWSEERMESWSQYYEYGADMPSNLAMMRHVTSNCAGRCLQRVVDTVLNSVPRDTWPNWEVSILFFFFLFAGPGTILWQH